MIKMWLSWSGIEVSYTSSETGNGLAGPLFWVLKKYFAQRHYYVKPKPKTVFFHKLTLTRWEWKPWLVLNVQAGDTCQNWLRIGKWQFHLSYARCGHNWQRYSYFTKTKKFDMSKYSSAEFPNEPHAFSDEIVYISKEHLYCRKCPQWKVLKHEL